MSRSGGETSFFDDWPTVIVEAVFFVPESAAKPEADAKSVHRTPQASARYRRMDSPFVERLDRNLARACRKVNKYEGFGYATVGKMRENPSAEGPSKTVRIQRAARTLSQASRVASRASVHGSAAPGSPFQSRCSSVSTSSNCLPSYSWRPADSHPRR